MVVICFIAFLMIAFVESSTLFDQKQIKKIISPLLDYDYVRLLLLLPVKSVAKVFPCVF